MRDMQDYTDCDATELAARVRRGDVQPSELVETAIAAVEQVEPKLHAVVFPMFDRAREAVAAGLPHGPFRGVPMVVKDFDGFVGGVPWTGSARFMDGWIPAQDSEAIARLRRAGFVFLAKTKLPELGLLGTTEPEWRGPTHNPWNLDHSPGGSSGGSAALVAARAVPVGHGGDGGGSLRIPASHCNLVGLKPTRGRVTLGPQLGEGWAGYVTWGSLTRSVRDTAAVLDVMAGPMPGDPYAAPPLERPLAAEVGADPGRLKIAVFPGSLYGRAVHPDVADAVTATAALLEGLGHTVEEARPEFDRHALVRAYLTQVAVGTAAEIDSFERWTGRTATPNDFEAPTWFLNQIGRRMRAVELVFAAETAHAAGRALGAFHTRYDVFLCPPVAWPAIPLGTLALSSTERMQLAALRAVPVGLALRKALDVLSEDSLERTPNTQLFNQTGQPAISVPSAITSDGLPIGVQLVAAVGGEAVLVRLASQIEAARPWKDRRPPVCA
jgi:amidase